MSVYAEGATELLLALATPTPKGYWGVPVLVWERPGTGKSTFIESLGRDGFPVFTMIASLHDPTDFSGLPVLHDGRMRFAPPDWLEVFEQSGQGILFLDELTTAPPTVQAALLRLVLERQVGAHSLPPAVRIAAAANPPDIAASAGNSVPRWRTDLCICSGTWTARAIGMRWKTASPARACPRPTPNAIGRGASSGATSWRAFSSATPRWRTPNLPKTNTPSPRPAAGTSRLR